MTAMTKTLHRNKVSMELAMAKEKERNARKSKQAVRATPNTAA
jgi:hypothetical protein